MKFPSNCTKNSCKFFVITINYSTTLMMSFFNMANLSLIRTFSYLPFWLLSLLTTTSTPLTWIFHSSDKRPNRSIIIWTTSTNKRKKSPKQSNFTWNTKCGFRFFSPSHRLTSLYTAPFITFVFVVVSTNSQSSCCCVIVRWLVFFLLQENNFNAVYRVYTFDLFPAHLMEEIAVRFMALHFLKERQSIRQQRQHNLASDSIIGTSPRRKSTLFNSSYISHFTNAHPLSSLSSCLFSLFCSLESNSGRAVWSTSTIS